MDYTEILKEIRSEIAPFEKVGAQATYIPELAKVNPDQFGICLQTLEGGEISPRECRCEVLHPVYLQSFLTGDVFQYRGG